MAKGAIKEVAPAAEECRFSSGTSIRVMAQLFVTSLAGEYRKSAIGVNDLLESPEF